MHCHHFCGCRFVVFSFIFTQFIVFEPSRAEAPPGTSRRKHHPNHTAINHKLFPRRNSMVAFVASSRTSFSLFCCLNRRLFILFIIVLSDVCLACLLRESRVGMAGARTGVEEELHFRCGFVVGVVPRQVSMVLPFPLLPAAATAKAVQG